MYDETQHILRATSFFIVVSDVCLMCGSDVKMSGLCEISRQCSMSCAVLEYFLCVLEISKWIHAYLT
jgi:hypothetical protein